MLLGSCWPISLMLVFSAGCICRELAKDLSTSDSIRTTLLEQRHGRPAVQVGLERALPLTAIVTFLLVPSTATRIFRTFLCDVIEYDDQDVRRYLQGTLLDGFEFACVESDDTSSVLYDRRFARQLRRRRVRSDAHSRIGARRPLACRVCAYA